MNLGLGLCRDQLNPEHYRFAHYRETFVDEGDIDMPRVLRILRRSSFDGVLIPDHTPQMACAALQAIPT